ncbi:hypothetical protein [Actinomyces urogenitalis]|uniref:hypothetical protein n=1 Tax=Actinomyces urogenitalis TaxID=103621 RepID=UPI00058B8BDC|nr:hypothetical protein [Actinomyces urogenitalis]
MLSATTDTHHPHYPTPAPSPSPSPTALLAVCLAVAGLALAVATTAHALAGGPTLNGLTVLAAALMAASAGALAVAEAEGR